MRPRVKSCGTLKLMEFNGILEFPVFPDFFVLHSYYVWYVVWHWNTSKSLYTLYLPRYVIIIRYIIGNVWNFCFNSAQFRRLKS